MTFSSGPIARNPGGGLPPLFTIPADRTTTWKPGVTYNAGIPVRNTIFQTISPASPYPNGPTVTMPAASPAVVNLSNTFTANTAFMFETTGTMPANTGPATVTITASIGNPIVVNWTGHGLSGGGQPIKLTTTGSLPTPLVAGQTYYSSFNNFNSNSFQITNGPPNGPTGDVNATGTTQSGTQSGWVLLKADVVYYVISAGLSNSAFEFSTSAGGAAVNTVDAGSGTLSIVLDDTQYINAALGSCPANNVVKLTTGVFRITANQGGVGTNNNNGITLRGSGSGSSLSTGQNQPNQPRRTPGTFVVDATATQLIKWDRATDVSNAVLGFGFGSITSWASHTNFTSDGTKGSKTCTLASIPAGLSAGVVVLVDEMTDFVTTSQAATTNVTVTSGNPDIALTSAGSFLSIWQDGSSSHSTMNFTTSSVVWFTTTANGFSTSTNYFVNSVAANSFRLSATPGGADITPSGNGTMTIQLINVDHPDVFWGPNNTGPGTQSTTRANFHQQGTSPPFAGRSIGQVMKVTNVNGLTVTFETPFHFTFEVARNAQVATYTDRFTFGLGVEDLMYFGGQNAGLGFAMMADSWIKNVEGMWNDGSCVYMQSCYRPELRDSFLHEQSVQQPGGAGYLLTMIENTSDALVENNIMWFGDKVNTMQSDGGGNVIAYNYMDDAFGAGFPQSPEAGVNAGHNTTTIMTLIEGNYSHAFKGDSFWGGSPYTTCWRNWFSGIRAAAAPLNTFTIPNGGGILPYGDFEGRGAVDIQAGSYKQNFVGNVLGFSGQHALSYGGGGYTSPQTTIIYEEVTQLLPAADAVMWNVGTLQHNGFTFDVTTIQTQLRQGNFNWVTGTQIWYANIGDTGTVNTGPTFRLANSLYIPGDGPPAFWSGTSSTPAGGTWPPVNPATGAVSKIPAHRRFETIVGLTIPPGNQP